MNETQPAASKAPLWLRMLGHLSRSTPYFKGKWRVMDAIFHRWFTHKRMWDDVRLSAGTVVACNLWDEVQFGIWWGGDTYEIYQTRYFRNLLKPGSVVCDIGSNVGYYSLTAAPLVGSEGRIYAFEPAARQFGLLTANATRNGFSQILPFKLALSDTPGEAVIHLEDEFNTGSASLRPVGQTSVLDESVTVTTLDDFVEVHGLNRLDVVKIDVEGYESAVVRGGQKTLERFRPVLLIEVKDQLQRLAGFSRQELYDELAARSYRPFRISSASPTAIAVPEDGTLVAFRHISQI